MFTGRLSSGSTLFVHLHAETIEQNLRLVAERKENLWIKSFDDSVF